jgi:hypothetical protein
MVVVCLVAKECWSSDVTRAAACPWLPQAIIILRHPLARRVLSYFQVGWSNSARSDVAVVERRAAKVVLEA